MEKRIKFISISISFFFLVLISKLFYLQIIKSPEIKEKSLSQNYKLIKSIPQRGIIFTSDNFPVVLNESIYILSIYKPALDKDINEIINTINNTNSNFISTNQTLINNFLNNQNQKWITFPTEFNEDQSKKLVNIKGVSLERIEKRFYPEEEMGKLIFGSIGKNEFGNSLGNSGLEAYYNKQLQGIPGYAWTSKDATGKIIISKKGWQKTAKDGKDLHTNINRNIQFKAEKYLSEGINKFNADSGSITIMNPSTGAIIAMTSISSTFSATKNSRQNTIISDLFEPGSIFKPIVVAMALDKKSINTNFICEKCNQARKIGEYFISNWDNEFHANSSLQDIIKNSDNVGMSYIISAMGLKNYQNYSDKLGINQKSGIDLSGETKSLPKKYWSEIDLATASFGQGISVSQLKMLQIFNTLANKGKMVQPKIVEYMSTDNNKIRPKTIKETQVFSEETVNQVNTILKYAVENGVVSKFKDKNTEVCGKSGTAQIAIEGGYKNSDKTNASYVGFSPCINPKFTMIVTINNPRTSPWGSSTAAPIWFDLAKEMLNLL